MTRTTSDDGVGEWAGQLCRDFAFLHARAARAGAQPKRRLAELAAAVRAGRTDARWTARLIELLRSLGIPAAEADRAWSLHLGGPGETGAGRRRGPIGGLSPVPAWRLRPPRTAPSRRRRSELRPVRRTTHGRGARVTPLLGQLGTRLVDRWIALLLVPGSLFVGAATVAVALGQRGALDVDTLIAWAERRAQTPLWSHPAGFVLTLAGFALAAAGVGLAAQLLGAGQLLWWLGSWPAPLRGWSACRVSRRRQRWNQLQNQFADLTTTATEDPRPSSDLDGVAAALADRRNRMATAEPQRPTWIGDQLAAVDTRVRNAYGLDLVAGWPRLWLLLPADPRAEIRAARQQLDGSSVLAAWGLLYLVLGVFWWPAVLVGALTWVVGWRSARQAMRTYAELIESVVDLHGAMLARALGIDCPAELTTAVGRAVTRRTRKGA